MKSFSTVSLLPSSAQYFHNLDTSVVFLVVFDRFAVNSHLRILKKFKFGKARNETVICIPVILIPKAWEFMIYLRLLKP